MSPTNQQKFPCDDFLCGDNQQPTNQFDFVSAGDSIINFRVGCNVTPGNCFHKINCNSTNCLGNCLRENISKKLLNLWPAKNQFKLASRGTAAADVALTRISMSNRLLRFICLCSFMSTHLETDTLWLGSFLTPTPVSRSVLMC